MSRIYKLILFIIILILAISYSIRSFYQLPVYYLKLSLHFGLKPSNDGTLQIFQCFCLGSKVRARVRISLMNGLNSIPEWLLFFIKIFLSHPIHTIFSWSCLEIIPRPPAWRRYHQLSVLWWHLWLDYHSWILSEMLILHFYLLFTITFYFCWGASKVLLSSIS